MDRSTHFQPTRVVATSLAAAALVVALGGCGRKAAVQPEPAAGADAGAAQQKTAGNAAELEFLEAMTQHHREGIEMARSAQPKLQDPKLRAIAEAIPAAQQAEIDRMLAWREEWYAGAPAAAPGTPTAERQLDTMAAGAAYDALFAATLADHHEAGIKIAEQALPRLRHKPVRRFARQMMRAQRAEVASLRARA